MTNFRGWTTVELIVQLQERIVALEKELTEAKFQAKFNSGYIDTLKQLGLPEHLLEEYQSQKMKIREYEAKLKEAEQREAALREALQQIHKRTLMNGSWGWIHEIAKAALASDH